MIFVAIGANLPGPDRTDALTTCRRVAVALDALPGLRLRSLSRWFATAPMPPSGQPPYINGVAGLSGQADPATLLDALHAIERAHGRARGIPNAARTLDLDIVAMGTLVQHSPDPVVPHPRMHHRAFVLRPLADVAPNWVHPETSRTLADLLADVASQSAFALAVGRKAP